MFLCNKPARIPYAHMHMINEPGCRHNQQIAQSMGLVWWMFVWGAPTSFLSGEL